MNICIVNDRFPPFFSGGGSVFAYNLVKELSKKNNVTVFTMDLGYDNNQTEEFEVKRIKLNNSPLTSAGFLEFIKRLPQEIEDKNFDVIHSGSAAVAPFLPKKNLLVSTHGSALSELKVLLKEKFFEFNAIKSLINSYFLELWAYHRSNKIIASSNAMALEIKKDYFIREELSVINYGYDKKLFNYSGGDSGYVLFAGRLSQRKGIFTLLKAIRGTQINLRIVGEGELKQKVINFIKRNNLNKSVKLLGLLEEEGLARQFKECSFFVCPSTYEPFGIATLEAMACGKAVIVSNVAGISEVIEDGKNGILFNPFNENELREKIIFLQENKNERKKLGINALKAAGKFSWEKAAKEYSRAYKELL